MVYPTLWRTSTPSLWDEVFSNRREFDRLFDRMLNVPNGPTATVWMPPVDVRETNDAFRVMVELPGLNPEEVEVNVENGVLTISGDKKHEVTEGNEEASYHVVERRYGRFERVFTLPRSVDADRVNAVYAHGVLTLTLPKAETARPRRVEIQAGQAAQIQSK